MIAKVMVRVRKSVLLSTTMLIIIEWMRCKAAKSKGIKRYSAHMSICCRRTSRIF